MINPELSFTAAAPNNDFSLTVVVDQTTVYQGPVIGTVSINYPLTQDPSQHTLTIVMSGKTPAHTQVDTQGNLVSDAALCFSNFKIAGVDISQTVYETAVYQHQYNGSGPAVQDKFYGTMGCNGTVTLLFYTPIYDWIVDHL